MSPDVAYLGDDTTANRGGIVAAELFLRGPQFLGGRGHPHEG